MKNNNLRLIILVSIIIISNKVIGQEYSYLPKNLPKVLHDSCFADDKYMLDGFASRNYSRFDFRNLSLSVLQYQSFDNHTKWPKSTMLPDFYKTRNWLESAKSPGLNLSQLHKEGITGKGVSVAIFDKPINPEHEEIKDNIIYIPIQSDKSEKFQHKRLHFHGIACASILCGKKTGVAPDAKLFYFAMPDDQENKTYNYCLAIEKLLQINDTLPQDKKIRIISISDNISKKDKDNFERWTRLVSKASKQKIDIIYSSKSSAHKFYTWGGCPPYEDNSNPENYIYTPYVIHSGFNDYKKRILLPADFRTVANNKTDKTYEYSGLGGFSSAIPYLAGLVALSLQLNPNLSLEEINHFIDKSKYITNEAKLIVNPVGLLNLIKTEIE